jgi:uncharacterized protein (TIGR02466 family)
MSKDAYIARLFSTPVVIYTIDDEIDILEDIKKEKFNFINCEENAPSQISDNLNILDKYPDTQDIIVKYFNTFKNSVMNYNTSFKLSRSWVTKTTKGQASHFHDHKNCMYSGVLYLGDSDEGTAPIQFMDKNSANTSFLIEPTEYNELNSLEWKLLPQKNMIIFFPSSLMHRIGTHNSEIARYSISFNFFPIGRYGMEDSFISL